MPPACGGLAGIIRPGYERSVYVGDAAIEALVAVLATPEAAIILAPVLAGQTYDLLHVCGAAQPLDPVITADDIADALNFTDLVRNQAAITRLRQWFIFTIWPTWCACADGTLPPPVTSAPLPPVSVNPGLPGGTLGPTCWDQVATKGKNIAQAVNFSDLGPPLGDFPSWNTATQGPAPRRLPTPLPTSVQYITTQNPDGSAQPSFTCEVAFYDAAGIIGGSTIFGTTTPAGTNQTLAGPVPSNAQYLYLQTSMVGTQGANPTATAELRLFCGGQTPTTPIVPCCPPDPNLAQRLTRIEQLEQIIIQLLGQPLLNHIDGTRHAGLTGAASINLVDSVTAIRVEVKSSLAGFQVNPGVPNYYFSVGFVTSIAAGSPLKGWRLVYQEQTFPIVVYADQIGFDLAPGVVIDIVELLPA